MSEETVALDWLRAKTLDYELNSDELHYALMLYNLVMNLQHQNQKYKEVFDKVEEYIKKRTDSCTAEANSTTNDTMCRITIIGLKHLLDILKEEE